VADGCGRGCHWSRFLGSCVWNRGYVYRGDVYPAYVYPGYAYPAYGYRPYGYLLPGLIISFAQAKVPASSGTFCFVIASWMFALGQKRT